MRSVGLIRVQARDEAEAVERAAAKGAELGCWLVIEHGLFVRRRAAMSALYGGTIFLAHGAVLHYSNARPTHNERVYDCIVRGEGVALRDGLRPR
jgi:hypothetical protein